MTDADRSAAAWNTVAVAALIVAHFLLRPLWVQLPVGPNLLVGALLVATLRLRAGHAALLGFVLGLLESGMALEGLGRYALALTLLGYSGARARDLLFADARFYVFSYLFVGTWIGQAALLMLGTAVPGPLRLVLGGAASAAITALVCGAVESAAVALTARRS
ncbi:MAG: rod shape-determining protein MreD [Gemmatimonadota bacterium]